MVNLKEIAAQVRENKITFEDAVTINGLDSRQKARLKQYCGIPIKNIRKREQIEDDLDEYAEIYAQMLAKKPPRPVKKVVINGKHYIDITADFIDCGD